MSKPRVSHHNLPQRLLKARDCLMGHFRPILKHFGVTEQQWRILRLLDEYAVLEPHAICEQCQFHSASMAGMLGRMDELGWIQRSRVDGDLRRVSVRLAPAGDELVRAMAPLIDAQYRLIENALGKDVLENLFTSLEVFIGAQDHPVPQVALPPLR